MMKKRLLFLLTVLFFQAINIFPARTVQAADPLIPIETLIPPISLPSYNGDQSLRLESALIAQNLKLQNRVLSNLPAFIYKPVPIPSYFQSLRTLNTIQIQTFASTQTQLWPTPKISTPVYQTTGYETKSFSYQPVQQDPFFMHQTSQFGLTNSFIPHIDIQPISSYGILPTYTPPSINQPYIPQSILNLYTPAVAMNLAPQRSEVIMKAMTQVWTELCTGMLSPFSRFTVGIASTLISGVSLFLEEVSILSHAAWVMSPLPPGGSVHFTPGTMSTYVHQNYRFNQDPYNQITYEYMFQQHLPTSKLDQFLFSSNLAFQPLFFDANKPFRQVTSLQVTQHYTTGNIPWQSYTDFNLYNFSNTYLFTDLTYYNDYYIAPTLPSLPSLPFFWFP